ncbi:Hypothetical_protein [Hexamita inflata]|uniref:Hypothetical_protein n=1 Tax=Hexamita inflata TaxID=28002 RepID=A0AA86P413_9EUKA|nr:Hypothetical protein HINF_LOCUS17993 [Hexamita inflata]
MRFQVWGCDFRAGKNLVGKSASNCVSRGCWLDSGRESVRFQGRRVRERASVGALMFCGGILLASAPLGLSRCFWALGSGERACESVLESKRERNCEREGGCSSGQKTAAEFRTEALGEIRPGEHARRPCWRAGRDLPERFRLAVKIIA